MEQTRRLSSLAAGVLGDGLGALTDRVLGKLAGKKKTNRCLDLARADGRPLVVVSQTTGFGGDALEDVADKRVHDGHGLAGYASVGVDLLQHLVDVDGVGLLSTMATLFLVSSISGGSCLARLGSGAHGLDSSFGCHSNSETEDLEKHEEKSCRRFVNCFSPQFIAVGGSDRERERTLEDTVKLWRENGGYSQNGAGPGSAGHFCTRVHAGCMAS